MDLHTPLFVNKNIEQIAQLFPNCVTETAEGLKIDFDQLRQELSSDIIEGHKERYRLDWPGKREAIVISNLPTTSTLRPVREESVDFNNTENIYIEGDNLEVLKILQESYLNKIKIIYIDPPYNTGNDFVYRDDFATDVEKWREKEYRNEAGKRMVVNADGAGRYHSDWLSMMYPRLKLARNLLTEGGVIFISIDDNEVHNLRKVCDEIFGESNFIASIIWERAYAPVNLKKHFSESHDYIICYAKNIELAINNGLPRTTEADSRYSNPDNDPRGPWKSSDLSVGPAISKNIYEIITPSGRSVYPPSGYSWRLSKSKLNEYIKDRRIWFGQEGNNVPSIKRFLSEVKNGITPMTIWKYTEVGHSQSATQNLIKLFSGKDFFVYPKSVNLMKRIITLYSTSNDIVLDFFAGSSTTAHAVMQLNADDGGNRKFIMVQLPEETDEQSEAYKAGYKNIAEIGKERIRRAAAQIKAEQEARKETNTGDIFKEQEDTAKTSNLDLGFRVYKLDSSNMKDVYYRPASLKQDQLDMFTDNIKADRTDEDLVTQIMLDWGLPLSLKIEQKEILGAKIYAVANDYLYCCFDRGVNEEFARAVAEEKPLRIVFRDSSFANDTAKENVKQLLQQLTPETQMRVI